MRQRGERRDHQRRQCRQGDEPHEHDPRAPPVGDGSGHETSEPRGGVLGDHPAEQAAGIAAEPIAGKGLIVRKQHQHGRKAGGHQRQPHQRRVAGDRGPPGRRPLPQRGERPGEPMASGSGHRRTSVILRLVEHRRGECRRREEHGRGGEDLGKAVRFGEPGAQQQHRREDRQRAADGHAHHHRPAAVPRRNQLSLQCGRHQLVEPVDR